MKKWWAYLGAIAMVMAGATPAKAGEIGLGVTLTAAGGTLLGLSGLGLLATGSDPEHYDDCSRLTGEKAQDACVQKHLAPLYGGMALGAIGLGVGIPVLVHGVRARREARMQAEGATIHVAPIVQNGGIGGALLSFESYLQ